MNLAFTLRDKRGISFALNGRKMNKIRFFILFLLFASSAHAQVIGHVDRKTKEFYSDANLKTEYRVFGYQYANNTTQKMICFSSHVTDVQDNYNRCPLGSYFDTGKMKVGDKITYLGGSGRFGKMSFVTGSGKKTIFYLPKSSFTIK